MAPRKRLSKRQAELLLPLLEEFNGKAKELIRMLNSKVAVKERKIAVLVEGISIPSNNLNVSVTAVDIRDTRGAVRGKGKYKKRMKWEDDIMRGPGGVII